MICNVHGARKTAVAIALITGSHSVIFGMTANPVAAQSSQDSKSKQDSKGSDRWLTDVARVAAKLDAKDKKPDTSSEPESKTADGSTVIPKGNDGAEDAEDKEANEAKEQQEKDKLLEAEQNAFRPDPEYGKEYSAEEQVKIYGGKSAVEPPRPILELGRQQYTSGSYDQSSTFLGELNPLLPGLSVYGDWRTAVAYNNNNGNDVAQIATRLNLDIDLKITGTERFHAFFTPLQDGAKFSRFEFGGSDVDQNFTEEFDPEPQTLFFEGDVGSIFAGLTGKESNFDLPFTVGLFPLFLQNGIWANDAILGGAFSLTAKNSAALGLSNFDVTFFAAFDDVENAGIIGNGKNDDDNANLYGVTAFIDAFDGYIETGYGLIDGRDEQEGLLTHFVTASYTRRYSTTFSNSTRVFANFGEDPDGNSDGFAIISENSLITHLPSTLLPYANFFVGFGNPQPLVDGNGAGILKNVGINFETDALTGFPKLDDSGSDAAGGAIGLQYLFDLSQQLVFEVATVQPFEKDGIGAQDAQYGFGVRYQVPIDRAWLFRADATYHILESEEEDNFGLRTELRRKF